MYNPSSENKGADQLRLCFRICKNLVSSLRGSNEDAHEIYCHSYGCKNDEFQMKNCYILLNSAYHIRAAS